MDGRLQRRDAAAESPSDFVLLAHDWCKGSFWEGESWLISEIADYFDRDIFFEDVGEAMCHGQTVRQEVAEAEIVLCRPHKTRVDGRQYDVPDRALPMRLVVTRLLDDERYILAQWMLLANVFGDVRAHPIALWDYWRVITAGSVMPCSDRRSNHRGHRGHRDDGTWSIDGKRDRIDVLVEYRLILELKAVDRIQGIHATQLLTYMRLAGKETGLLINFNVGMLRDGIQRFKLRSLWFLCPLWCKALASTQLESH